MMAPSYMDSFSKTSLNPRHPFSGGGHPCLLNIHVEMSRMPNY
jgi:hypothetical protein